MKSFIVLTIFALLMTQDFAVAGTCSTKPKTITPITKNTFFVDGKITQSGDGTAWEKAFKTLQEAVDAVEKANKSGPRLPHTIAVAQGTYQIPNPQAHALIQYENMAADLTILGGFVAGSKTLEERATDSALTVLQGSNNNVRALIGTFPKTSRAKLTLDGFTVRDFGTIEGSDRGGAMVVMGGNAIVKNVVFKDNQAQNGGAIWVDTATVLFDHCSFLGNHAESGGAIAIYVSDAKLVQALYLNNCTIGGAGMLGNIATNGGFIFARQEDSMLKIHYTDPKYGETPVVDNQIAPKTVESKQ